MNLRKLPRRERIILEEKIDMVGNMRDMMNMYQQIRNNPQMLRQRFNIPQDLNLNDPNAITQHLMNTGQITQEQYNNANNMRNNPIIQKMFNLH